MSSTAASISSTRHVHMGGITSAGMLSSRSASTSPTCLPEASSSGTTPARLSLLLARFVRYSMSCVTGCFALCSCRLGTVRKA